MKKVFIKRRFGKTGVTFYRKTAVREGRCGCRRIIPKGQECFVVDDITFCKRCSIRVVRLLLGDFFA